MSCLTASSAFFKSDCKFSISCSSGLVNTAVSACQRIVGNTGGGSVAAAGAGTGSGACRLTTAMITNVAATPVRLLAHQNANDFDSRRGLCRGSGLMPCNDA